MKKLISTLAAMTLVTTSSLAAVSCAARPNVYLDIYLITDAGKVTDRSFNESGFDGGNKFLKEVLGKENTNVGYIQPPTLEEIPNSYVLGEVVGTKNFILPGYKHGGANLDKADEIATRQGGTVIYIDGAAGGKENTIGIIYRADISGFYAGMASILWWFQNHDDSVKDVKLATFGGMDNGAAVNSFMAGYLTSINVFNWMIEEDKFEQDFMDHYKLTKDKKASRVSAQKSGYSKGQATNWFSGSFDANGGLEQSKTFLSQGANFIMPVAGPQTANTLTAIKDTKKEALVVGVDTDQVTAYSEKELFVTSAEKDIVNSTAIALAHSKMYYDKVDLNKLDEIFEGISVTEENEGGEFVDKPIGEKGDWSGQDIWLGGSISTTPDNKVTADDFDKLKEVFPSETLNAMSKIYFSEMANSPTAEGNLSNEAINKLTEIIKENIEKSKQGGVL